MPALIAPIPKNAPGLADVVQAPDFCRVSVVDAKTLRSEGPPPAMKRDYATAAGPVTGRRQAHRRPLRRRPALLGRRRAGLREVEQRLGVAERLAACIDDPRVPERVRHGVADILRFRMLMIAAGYEDGNDADSLRHDPVFKLALDRLPDERRSARSRPSRGSRTCRDRATLLRMARAMVGLYCASFRQVPRRIVLDIDDTFDAVHGGQQLRLFNAHHDEYGFQPIVVFDGEGRPVAAMLRPARRPTGRETRFPPPPGARDPRPLAAGRDPDPRRQPLLRAGGARLLPRGRRRLRPRPAGVTRTKPAPSVGRSRASQSCARAPATPTVSALAIRRPSARATAQASTRATRTSVSACTPASSSAARRCARARAPRLAATCGPASISVTAPPSGGGSAPARSRRRRRRRR